MSWESLGALPEGEHPHSGSRSRVVVHFAVTADGKVSTAAGTPAQFTSARDKQRLLEVRSENDAIMVARGTLERDRMSLGLPDGDLRDRRAQRGLAKEPLRVIISGNGQLNPDLPLFKHRGAPIVLYTTRRMPSSKKTELETQLTVHMAGEQQVNLAYVLHHLFTTYRVRSLVCEGGPTLVRSLAHAGLIDRIILTVAAKLFGGSSAPTLTGLPGEFLPASRRFRLVRTDIGDNEFYLTYESDACSKPIRF